MKLYYMPHACSLADHIVLEWVGAPYEAIRMDPLGLKSAEFIAMNPMGAVPLLEDGDFKLTENVAILGYIADLYPEARLLGGGPPRERAEVIRWTAYLNSDVHKAFVPIFAPSRFLPDAKYAQLLSDNAKTHVRVCLEVLDAQLKGRAWLTGTRSIADPYLFVVARWAKKLHLDMSGLTNLDRFSQSMHDDRGVQVALEMEEPESRSS